MRACGAGSGPDLTTLVHRTSSVGPPLLIDMMHTYGADMGNAQKNGIP